MPNAKTSDVRELRRLSALPPIAHAAAWEAMIAELQEASREGWDRHDMRMILRSASDRLGVLLTDAEKAAVICDVFS